MAETITADRAQFIATKKDALGTGFGSMERAVEKLDYGKRFVNVTLEYDYDVDGAVAINDGTVALRAEGETSAFVLPESAQIIMSAYRVTETFTSSADGADLSIGIPTDDVAGIVAETAISAGGNVWDAGSSLVPGIQTGVLANASNVTTAERNIVLQNGDASEATTAGALKLYITYIVV